jgi:hypothetical protein
MPLPPVICPETPQYSSDVYANMLAPKLVRQNNLRCALAHDYCGWGLCARPSASGKTAESHHQSCHAQAGQKRPDHCWPGTTLAGLTRDRHLISLTQPLNPLPCRHHPSERQCELWFQHWRECHCRHYPRWISLRSEPILRSLFQVSLTSSISAKKWQRFRQGVTVPVGSDCYRSVQTDATLTMTISLC